MYIFIRIKSICYLFVCCYLLLILKRVVVKGLEWFGCWGWRSYALTVPSLLPDWSLGLFGVTHACLVIDYAISLPCLGAKGTFPYPPLIVSSIISLNSFMEDRFGDRLVSSR